MKKLLPLLFLAAAAGAADLSVTGASRTFDVGTDRVAVFDTTSGGLFTVPAGGATVERVALMSKSVAGRCQVKAAGGIRSLATLQALYDVGARRFGVGVGSARKILAEIQ